MATTGVGVLPTSIVKSGLPQSLAIEGLQADNLDTPLALHSAQVRLSWRLRCDQRGTLQTAYRIGVASSRERALAGRFDLWDSGKISSSQCFDIRYAGRSLLSRMHCHWMVTVWDNKGRMARSSIAMWGMGLLEPSDWTASWIAAETLSIRSDREAGFQWMTAMSNATGSASPGEAFRLAFEVASPSSATLYIAATARPEAYIDGKAVAVPPRDPNAWGPPPAFRVNIDFSPGRHALALFVPRSEQIGTASTAPQIAVLVRLDQASGQTSHVTGQTMRSASVQPAGWSARDFDDHGWPIVKAVDAAPPAPMPGNGAFLMRRHFAAAGPVKSARLFVAALGAYRPFINGMAIGDARLAPESSDYRQRVLYRVYDVTASVKPGENVLAAMVADGWYGSYTSPSGRYSFGGPPLRLRAQLEIEYTNGLTERVLSDEQWQVSRSAITSSEIYDGEDYDGRLEQPDWARPGFKAGSGWEQAHHIATPDIAMVGASIPAIRECNTIKPVKVVQISPGRAVVDFGQNFAGWIRLAARGEAGQKITVRFSELLGDNGEIDQSNLRGARAADVFIMRGGPGGEILEPQFTYHGFRYAQIEGLAADLTPSQVTGVIVHTGLAETGQLEMGQFVPQRLWLNGLWSQRSNFVGIPTDCPQRDERLGWMGDAHVFWDAACFNMDTAAFTRKFMMDVRDAQRVDGAFPDVAPNSDHVNFTGPGSSPGWGDAGVFLPWTSWQRYGDTSVIDDHWNAMERYMASILAANPEMLWKVNRGNDYGDWLALDAKKPGDPTTPKDLVGTAMWKAASDAMGDMAAAVGRSDDERRYRSLSSKIKAAFQAAYIQDSGAVGNGSQTGYILALRFGLLQPRLSGHAASLLVTDIVKRGRLLSTGFLGTPYSLDVLADAGYSELVYDLLLRTAYPSWGYMIAHGATTIWERWNGDAGDRSMNSFNHYALGAVAGFMYRRIAGIAPTGPGFSSFSFDPVYDPRMPKAGAHYQSRLGPIKTAWMREGAGKLSIQIEIPPGARCSVCLPVKDIAMVREGGRHLLKSSFAHSFELGKLTFNVGAGKYTFDTEHAQYG